MEFRRSFLRRHFAGKPLVTSRNVDCFYSDQWLAWISSNYFESLLLRGENDSKQSDEVQANEWWAYFKFELQTKKSLSFAGLVILAMQHIMNKYILRLCKIQNLALNLTTGPTLLQYWWVLSYIFRSLSPIFPYFWTPKALQTLISRSLLHACHP